MRAFREGKLELKDEFAFWNNNNLHNRLLAAGAFCVDALRKAKFSILISCVFLVIIMNKRMKWAIIQIDSCCPFEPKIVTNTIEP